MSEDREINTTEIKYAEQIRRHQPRAPRRRGNDVSSADMVHISESLEESVAVYEHNSYSGRRAVRSSVPQSRVPAYGGTDEYVRNGAASGNTYTDVNAYSGGEQSAQQRTGRADMSQNANFTGTGRQVSHGYDDKPHIEAKASYADDYDDSEGYDGGSYGSNVSRQSEQPVGRNNGDGEKKKKKKHPVLKLMLLLVICAAAFIGYKFITGQSGYYTVAVFGVDSRNGNTGKDALSDVNIIARVDRASGEIKLVSLYRDTYTKINSDGKYHKLNEAYFKGGPDQAIWAVEHNTDVKIDDYATFNWKAVADTINILGGVDLEITDKEFKYINAFITETVNSTGIGSVQLEHAGMNHLDGVQAVAYARLRLMDTDYQRTERQRKVIGLALDKAKNADYKTLATIIATVMPEISTSVTPDDLIPFARGIDRYYISETAGFPFDKQGMNIGKLDCVIPVTLESNAVKLHEFLYPDTPYTPSGELKSISDHIIEVTGLTG